MNRASLSFGTTSSGLIYMYIQLESKEKGWWIEKKKEIMIKNFPNLMNTINPQIQEFQQASSKRNMKTTTLRHNQIT